MRQQEFIPETYVLRPTTGETSRKVLLASNESGCIVEFSLEAIRPGVFRTTFTSQHHPLPPYPSAKLPTVKQPATIEENGPSHRTFRTHGIEANINWSNAPIVSVGFEGQPPLHTDLPHRSYVLDGPGIAHYSRYFRGDLHLGLGEKSAPMDLSNRHFTLSATDCFGYDVLKTDPMYKHIPLLIRATPDGVVATFSTSHARGFYSVGSEMDGMWGYYKIYRQDHGGLEQYILVGKTLHDVIKLYADLVGYPLLVPRWAFGYLGGGMKYSMLDEPSASEALMEWAQKVEEFDIPCSGFQLSSGYTVSATEPKTRNVFTWNRHRFPDPIAFCSAFRRRGIRLIGNIKPYVLSNHPAYQGLLDAGALFKDPKTGKTAIARLWSAGGGESGLGSHIDFTSKAGYEFWYNGVKELRRTGIDCMWNDNNEYVIPSDDWEMAFTHALFRDTTEPRKDIGLWGRALHTELHGKASHDAVLEVKPEERPFVLTRSATAGTMRYACSTWSGDNITSFAGMRGANALSLNAGMCLLQCYGHDIGGFEGPQPTPELLLRWVQLGIHSPRFAINCFKTGNDNLVGDVIEPWMYPEILPEVRKAIQRRYEIIPYLYSSMLKSHFTAVPPQRWVGWDYEADPEVWSNKTLKDGEQQYWLGDTLLVGGVFEAGLAEGWIYAPKKTKTDPGFFNLNSPYQHLAAGQWHLISSPWKQSIPILARIGGAVPVGKNKQVVAPGDIVNEASLPADDWRGVEIFPPPAGTAEGVVFRNSWLEDDGISPPPAKIATISIEYAAFAQEIRVSYTTESNGFIPPWVENGLDIILPHGDERLVVSAVGDLDVEKRSADDAGERKRFRLVRIKSS